MKRQDGKSTPRPARRVLAGLVALLAAALTVMATPAFANAPNPTSVHIDSESFNGTSLIVTVSGTWTWDQRVPNGAQVDCNDSRIGGKSRENFDGSSEVAASSYRLQSDSIASHHNRRLQASAAKDE